MLKVNGGFGKIYEEEILNWGDVIKEYEAVFLALSCRAFNPDHGRPKKWTKVRKRESFFSITSR